MTNAVESIIIHVLEIHNGIKVPVDAVTARKKTFHRICTKLSFVVFLCW